MPKVIQVVEKKIGELNIAKYRNFGRSGEWTVLEFTMDQIEKHIQILTTMVKKITHCLECGATWYDDGLATVECPECKIIKLSTQVERVEKAIGEWTCYHNRYPSARINYLDAATTIQEAIRKQSTPLSGEE